MKIGDIVYYKARQFNLIEELDAGLVRIKLNSSHPETRIVEKKYLETKEEYEKKIEEKAYRSHITW